MREQIKLIIDTKNLEDSMSATKRMASLQRSGYSLVDMAMDEGEQSYYLEKRGLI